MKHSQTSIDEKVLREVYKDENGVKLFEYKPSLLFPYYCNMEPMSFVRRIRLVEEFLRKGSYRVYYLAVDNTLIGYNLISPGGRRLSFSTAKDIVSGPTYIDPQYRNRGYNGLMQKLSYICYERDFDYIYVWIEKKNVASTKSYLKIGFEKVGEISFFGLRRKMIPTENGTSVVYRLLNPKKSRG